ncbi:MAG: rhodanese-like domain-containing protein [Campylobacterales bacterium]
MRFVLSLFFVTTLLFAGYKDIDPKELQKLKDEGVVVIDIRTEPEWIDVGVIPGSQLATSHIDDGLVYDEFVKKLDEMGIYDDFILVCRSGNRSRELSERLNQDGYDGFYNLKNGIKSWIVQRKAVQKPMLGY